MKRVFLLAILAASPVFAQNADISGAQLLSGDADARLQALAREAIANKRKLVISAPEYWHEMILEQIRKGGGADLEIEVRDSFAEAVMVRSDAGGAEAPAATPAPEPEPEPRPQAEPVARPATPVQPAPAAAPRPATPAPAPTPTPAPAPAPARPAPAPVAAPTTPAPAAAPVRTPGPTPARVSAPAATPAPRAPASPPPAPAPTRAPAAAPAAQPSPPPAAPSAAAAPAAAPAASRTERSATAEINAIKRRLEGSLNGGEKITRTLVATQLEPNDVLYVREPVIVVQRRDRLRNQMFWLEGGIELRRVELRTSGANRYVVAEPIRNVANPRLRTVRENAPNPFTADPPDAHAGERSQMERRYNGGNPIERTLSATQLVANDVVYVGEDLVVVVRVAGIELERYWLVGRIDLGRAELLKDGNNRYRVLKDIRE